MNIVITFAVRSECRAWRRDAHAGNVYLVTTGIGMRGSRQQLRELLAMPADFCIASGFAGGLSKQQTPGSIVVARGVKTEPTNTILTSDGRLVDAAVRCGANPVSFFFTSNTVVNSPIDRSRLSSAADVLDMESFHVLAEARQAGVPAVAIRAISDGPDDPLPLDFNAAVNDCGELRWLTLIAQLLKHPARLADFARFGLASSRAARHLARFLDEYVKFLATHERVRSPMDTMAA